jgi:hypothetical protein
VSFIGLILLVLVTIGIIVLFSLKFTKREVIPTYEKFTVLIWIILIGIYDFSTYSYVRRFITFDKFLSLNVGFTFISSTMQFILLLFVALLIIFNMFGKPDKKVMSAITLALVNIIFFTLAIATVNYIGFDFTNATVVPSIIGNHFLMLGALATIVCTVLAFMEKYPVKKTTPK